MQKLWIINETFMKAQNPIVFWLVDPFSKTPELQRSAAMAIHLYTQHGACQVYPIYFFSAYLTGEYPLSLPPGLISEIKQTGQDKLDAIIKDIPIFEIKPLHIVARPYISMRESIEYLSRLTRRIKGVELLVTSTHSRSGFKRLFMGSFAETLMLHAHELPILFINPHWRRMSDFKKIVFPTDFSDQSKAAFLSFLPIARRLKSTLTLIHKLAFSWPPALMVSLDVGPFYEKVIQDELESKKSEAKRWVDYALKEGVNVNYFIDRHEEDSVVESILHYTKNKKALIALAAQSSPITTTLLGSTTRSLIRHSADPIWVIPSQLTSAMAKSHMNTATSSQKQSSAA